MRCRGRSRWQSNCVPWSVGYGACNIPCNGVVGYSVRGSGARRSASSSDSGLEEKEPPAPSSNKFDSHVNAIIKKGIQMRTSTQALASALRAQRLPAKKAKKKEAFKKTSVYQTLFPGII